MRTEKTMKKEIIFPLVIGLVLGVLAMLFWQFNSKLNNQKAALAQLEQVVSTNTKTTNDIVSFINNATAQNKGTDQASPAATPAPESGTENK